MPRITNKLGIYKPQIIKPATHAQNLLFFKFLITISTKIPLAIDVNVAKIKIIVMNTVDPNSSYIKLGNKKGKINNIIPNKKDRTALI